VQTLFLTLALFLVLNLGAGMWRVLRSIFLVMNLLILLRNFLHG